jgi:hypothetical protein
MHNSYNAGPSYLFELYNKWFVTNRTKNIKVANRQKHEASPLIYYSEYLPKEILSRSADFHQNVKC